MTKQTIIETRKKIKLENTSMVLDVFAVSDMYVYLFVNYFNKTLLMHIQLNSLLPSSSCAEFGIFVIWPIISKCST